jgi:hypothetical protein
LLAVVFRLTITTVAGPPAANDPPNGDALSQGAGLVSAQAMGMDPRLVNANVCDKTLNGPPAPPTALKPFVGVSCSGSLTVNAKERLRPMPLVRLVK